MTDDEILIAIQDILDGTVRELSMLDEIAELLVANGYAISDRKGKPIEVEE